MTSTVENQASSAIPFLPRVDYDAAMLAVWRQMLKEASSGPPFALDGAPGYKWEGSVTTVFQVLWPRLSKAQRQREYAAIQPRMVKLGYAAVLKRGGGHSPSTYWVAAEDPRKPQGAAPAQPRDTVVQDAAPPAEPEPAVVAPPAPQGEYGPLQAAIDSLVDKRTGELRARVRDARDLLEGTAKWLENQSREIREFLELLK